MSDYYAILQVPPTATSTELRQAYVKLARERHPDRFQDPIEKERAQEFFKEVSEAYNTLSNERARKEYDGVRDKPVARTPEESAQMAFDRGQEAMERRQYH